MPNLTRILTKRSFLITGLLLSLNLVYVSVNATPLQVSIPNGDILSEHDPSHFYEQALKLALEKTKSDFGDYQIAHHPITGGTERIRVALSTNNGIDVTWGSLTKERQQAFATVNFNLLSGLNSYRILLIRAEDKPEFLKINSLAELRHKKAGVGAHWTDLKILEANDLPYVPVTNDDPRYRMLAAKRFDYMVRGAHELTFEIDAFQGLNIEVEPHIILKYDNPINYCYFVNKNNTQLQNRLLTGLLRAQADGSFDKLLRNHPAFTYAFKLRNDKSRVQITLKNNLTIGETTP